MNPSDSRLGDRLIVAQRTPVSSSVVELTLQRDDGGRLPDWAPGAHIDLVLPSGRVRQYSLCGDRWQPYQYRVAVQRDPHSTGGSEEIHDQLPVGTGVAFGGPRNNFRLAPASEYRFIAGGIGITPLLPMIHQADILGVPWKLLYLGHELQRMAYRQLKRQYPERITLHASGQDGRASVRDWLGTPDPDALIYACGPERLLEALPDECSVLPSSHLRIERFSNPLAEVPISRESFDIVLSRSGRHIEATGSTSVVEVLSEAGIDVITSCSRGVCGTCEVGVVDGRVDHRDAILDDDERSRHDCMFPCVSRSLSDRLVLDL